MITNQNTVLQWLDRVPIILPQMIVGRSSTKIAKVKITPARESVMVGTSFIQSTPLWLIVVTKVKTAGGRGTLHRVRVWLRTVNGGLLQIEDNAGFVTLRGAEWCAFKILNKITNDMRDADAEFEKSVSSR
jgi:hypothetical protein